ncbi:sulfotransferase [Salinisphaera sp. T31B1]|uniref:sulfotransferase family protein n=1 Tax=Salinisphaera sp. T31B1 TaxID=727963 RepID=UPI00333E7504
MKYLFVVGCPRSGTTWLQMLLAQHPAIATAQETHLFNGYLSELRTLWARHADDPRGIGLQAVYTESAFDALCADIAARALDQIAGMRPEAQCVLEKTPAHVRHVGTIAQLLPGAYFVHLVRDPRAVTASLTTVGRSWGAHWAAPDCAENARRWVADVAAGRAIAGLTDRCLELRYEDLAGADGPQALGRIVDWLGLDRPPGFEADAFDRCRIDRLREGSADVRAPQVIANDPAGFYGPGASTDAASRLTRRELRSVEYICGPLMDALGYTRSSGVSPRKPATLRLQRYVDGLEWRLQHWQKRLFRSLRHRIRH